MMPFAPVQLLVRPRNESERVATVAAPLQPVEVAGSIWTVLVIVSDEPPLFVTFSLTVYEPADGYTRDGRLSVVVSVPNVQSAVSHDSRLPVPRVPVKTRVWPGLPFG